MIYLFDENEKFFKLLKKESLKSADQTYSLTTENYVSDRLTIETKGMNAGEVEKAHFMAIQSLEDRHKFHYFFIARKETDKTTILEGVQSGIEELRKTPVYDKRPRNLSARNVIEDLLRDTNWVPRFIADTGLKNTNLYYTSVFEALKKVCKVWGLEMQFFVEMNGNQIGARFIDFKKKIGEATGKRVVYGHNALKILSESESTNLFTALVGRGKGEQVSSAEETGNQADGYGRKINFEDIVWAKSKGNPVDKPAGQKYVEIPEMTQKYGILNADGTRRPKIGFIDFGDEEDREALLQQTYDALKDSSRPQLTLKTSSVYLKNVGIGDTIRVVRHDRKLDYETRVFEITINRLNNKSTDIKLGDRTSQSNEAKIQSAADRAVEEFVEGNFNDFIKNIPDFLPSADGFNQNWYSEEDPTVTHPKKVMIGDIWYKPDPEHEGHKIMLRWTGEMWEEILRTYNAERLKEQIEVEMAEMRERMSGWDEDIKAKIADLLAKAGLAESTIEEAKSLIEQAKEDLEQAREVSNAALQSAMDEARRLDQEERKLTEAAILAARERMEEEARRLIGLTEEELMNSLNALSTEIEKTSESIKLKADKRDIDELEGKMALSEANIKVEAGEIAQRVSQQIAETQKGRIEAAESAIWHTAEGIEQLTTKVIQTEEKSIRQENTINSLVAGLLSKVSQSDYDNLKRTVDGHTTEMQQTKDAIGLKADKTFVKSIDDKAGQALANSVQAAASLGLVSKQVADAVKQASQNAQNVSRVQAELTVANQAIQQKVSKSDFDLANQKLTNAETQINAIAGQISTKLSRSEVDGIVDAKGFITNSVFSNTIEQTERGLTARIAQVETKIPDGYSGANLILEGARQTAGEYWKNTVLSKHGYYYNGEKYHFQLNTDKPDEIIAASNRFKVKRNTKYALSFWTYSSWNMKSFDVYFLGRKKGESNNFTSIKQPIKEKAPSPNQAEYVTVIFDSGENDEGYIRFDNNGSKDSKTAILGFGEVMLVEGNTPARYSPSPDELATTAALHEVRDTVDAHTRTLTTQGGAISQMVQTANGLFSRVASVEENSSRISSQINATSTQVSQLAGSWAVQNLRSTGDIVNQINLNRDGSVRIAGSKVQIDGQTYIQDGVISSAKIGNLDAGKITTGTLNAARINLINLDASKITTGSLDARFIRGGVLSSLNGKTQFDLNGSKLTFNQDATIEFNSQYNALVRRKGTHTAFVHFNDVASASDGGVGSLYASIGVTSSGDGINSMSSGRFAGLRVFRGARGRAHEATVDQTEIYGDLIKFRDDFNLSRGLTIDPVAMNEHYYMSDIIKGINWILRVFVHLNNVGGNWKDPAFVSAITNEFNSNNVGGTFGVMPTNNTWHF